MSDQSVAPRPENLSTSSALAALPTEPLARLLAVMAKLRDPNGGCPWDLKQDFASLVKYTLEEAYEVVDAVEKRDFKGLCEELGDDPAPGRVLCPDGQGGRTFRI